MTFREVVESVLKASKDTGHFQLWSFLSGYAERARDLFSSLKDIEIVEKSSIPISEQIPFDSPKKWLKVANVSCLFIDMTNSSILDFNNHASRVAQIYEAFTTPLVRIMAAFGANYIDIKGDGAFALFDDDSGAARAVLTATTFRKYFEDSVEDLIEKNTNGKVEIGFRGGLTYGPVIFKRIGLRGDKKNEVWTNSTVNNCVKLATVATTNRLIVSAEAFRQLRNHEALVLSCGCGSDGEKVNLWDEKDIDMGEIGILTAMELRSTWCDTHGEDYVNWVINDFGIELD